MSRWQQLKYGVMGAFQRFMMGRNGVDQLSLLLLAAGGVLLLGSSFVGSATASTLLFLIAYAMLFYGLFRSYSRNIAARRRENAHLTRYTDKIARTFNMYRQMWRERGTYKYLKCPSCKKRMKVPRGRGKINIHCVGCGESFVKKV